MPFEIHPGTDYSDNLLPINYAAAEFYCLEAISLLCNGKFEPFRHSHERFRKDLLDYKERFEEVFATALFDYIVYAVAGELRHAPEKCDHYFENFRGGGSRCSVMDYVERFCPYSLCKAGVDLFENYSWQGGYGGYKWASIARAISLHKAMPTTAFIDHCIDLSHNNGTAFNKSDYRIFFVYDYYTSFLSDKSEAESPLDLLNILPPNRMHVGISYEVITLLERMIALFFHNETIYENAELIDAVEEIIYSGDSFTRRFIPKLFAEYDAVKWGSYEFIPHYEHSEDEEEDHECYDDCECCWAESCPSHPSRSCDDDCMNCSYECCSKSPANNNLKYYYDYNVHGYKRKSTVKGMVIDVRSQQAALHEERKEENAAW